MRPQGRPPKLTPEQAKECRELYDEGVTQAALAKRYHTSVLTISKVVKRTGAYATTAYLTDDGEVVHLGMPQRGPGIE